MVIRIIIYIIIGFVLLFGYIKFLERNGVFYPNKKIEITPASLNITFDDVYIKTKDNLKINGWFIPAQDAKYTFLFFHGNAGNLQDRIEKIIIFKELGVNVFIIDYRGYGRSEGRPSEHGLYLDAQAAYDYLVNQRNFSPNQIILFGESLGTAVAIDLASKIKSRGVILEGAFSRGKDMAKAIYPYLPRFFFSNIYDSLTKVK
ncbi:MAG: lysophospholipase, partial [Candidatus Omnitrophica bacterium]|nr:lysophospholipase [Candidatus Omnitrophota bacterium]